MNTHINPSNTNRLRRLRRRAFTLVELLLVLTILAILAGLVLPKLAGQGKKARIQATQAEIANFKTALSMYEVDNGDFPTGRNGLQALMVKPSGATQWKGPYLDKDLGYKFLDKWDRPYVYEKPGKHNPTAYDLYSLGPNGTGGNEAIGNWTAPTPTE